MKVIDGIELLRMIKNGEIREKQKFTDGSLTLEYFDKTIKVCKFSSDGTIDYYENDYEIADLISRNFTLIEEEKEIEEINIWYEFDGKNNDEIIYHMCTELKDKINELVRELNKIKKEGK